MKKLRIRDLFLKYPLLDKARVLSFAWIFKHGIGVYDRSYRVISVIPEASEPYVRSGSAAAAPGSLDSLRPAIYAYFHGQMYTLLGLTPRYRMNLIVSNSRDGEMIARAAEGMGFGVARGSKTEGGVKAALHLISAAREKKSLLFPVDGPRGPFEVVKSEVLRVAQITELPIIPIVSSARTRDLMKTWDKYNCPYTHTQTLVIYGEPIHVPPEADKQELESLRLALETAMVQLKSKASQFFVSKRS